MHKKAFTSTIVLISMIILVSAGVFLIATKTHNNVTPVEQEVVNSDTQNVSETSNEVQISSETSNEMNVAENTIDTSNWQTYKNEEYGFEVKYPKDYVYSEVDGVRFYKKQCEMNKFNICPKGISINTYPNDKNDFIKSWSKECDAFKIVKIRGVKSDVSSCDERLSSTFAQINLYDHIVKYSFVTDNNVFYDIHISYFGSDNIEIENNIFNSISFAHN